MPSVGFINNVTPRPNTAAITAVTKKTKKILPIILPNRFISPIEAMADAILKNTMGTMIINNKLTNKSPKGLRTAALGPKNAPITPPKRTEPNKIMENK